MVKNKKRILFLVILLIILYIIINIFPVISSGKKYDNTVFLGSSTKVDVKDGKIKVYNENTRLIKQKVKLYFKSEFIDTYITSEYGDTTVVDNTYIFHNNNGLQILPKNIIAHTDDLLIKIKESDKRESHKLDDIYAFAKSNNITFPTDIELDYLYITSFDYDDDGKEEYIYSFGLIENNGKDYESIIYLKNNNDYILICREKSSYNIDYKRLYFLDLIDFTNDGNYKFVLEKMMSEYGPDYYELYDFNGNQFTKIGAVE